MEGTLKKPRYALIDALRGFSLLNMIAYHLCFDIFQIYAVDTGWMFSNAAVAWERFICFSFIIISGVSLNFSKHAIRRGIIVNACGMLMTAVTLIAVPNFAIWFGVLSCIGTSMILAQLLRRPLERLNQFLYQNYITAFFGFPPKGFISSDYFPLLPWFFLFLFGFFLWRIISKRGADKYFTFKVPFFAAAGRYTLWIYLLHQPVLMGVCFLIFGHF